MVPIKFKISFFVCLPPCIRVQSLSADSEVESYASFIAQALEKTRGRECVPSWEEIQGLMGRQEILCTVHYPGPGCCQIPITSHTTANEVLHHLFPLQQGLGTLCRSCVTIDTQSNH